jgi:hypothetical protein
MREELAAVREELELLKVNETWLLARRPVYSTGGTWAESDEFRDQLSECNALIEHLRSTKSKAPRPGGGGKRGFFWGAGHKSSPGNLGTPSNDDDVIDDEVVDTTEENTVCLRRMECWSGWTEENELPRTKETRRSLHGCL